MPNIVIFLNDALRADHLGAYGYGGNTSPFFDRLTANGTLFEWAFANATKTRQSIPILFSSNSTTSTGNHKTDDMLPHEVPTLAEILRAMGYATAAFTASPYTGPRTGTHQGFSSLLTPQRFLSRRAESDTEDVAAAPDAEVLCGDLMNEWIQMNADRSFFLFIHTMDSHPPYDPPKLYRRFYVKSDSESPVRWDRKYDTPWLKSATRESRLALYDGEIAYGDDYLRHFFDMLDEHGLVDSTLFVFLSDHGEYFGEHGMWGHGPPAFVQGTHIPLLFIGPGFPAGVRVEEKAQLLDVMPTVLDALGFEPNPHLFQGESLRPVAQGKPSPDFGTRTLFIEGDHQGELSFHCGGFHMFPEKNIIFDLSEDPGEISPLNEFVLETGLKSLSREVAHRYLDTCTKMRGLVYPSRNQASDNGTQEQLRSLGYSQ
jgi:arylsulfatase